MRKKYYHHPTHNTRQGEDLFTEQKQTKETEKLRLVGERLAGAKMKPTGIHRNLGS